MRRYIVGAMVALGFAALASARVVGEQTRRSAASGQALFIPFADFSWKRMVPELGEGSPEMALLRVDPKTQATHLAIRVPKGFHVPRHWHTANETHTIVSGTFVMEHEGKKIELGPGSYNYIPGRMVHQAWTKPDEGTVLFITTDGAWDIHWVDPPPGAERRLRPSASIDRPLR